MMFECKILAPARDLAGFAYDLAKRTGRLAKAKDAHDVVIATAYRAQADALIIESEAKRRLADEYDDAQKRGEVKKAGNPNSSKTEELPGPRDIGLTRKEIFEAREIRDAEALLKAFCSAYLHITKVNVKTHDINAI